MHAPAWWNGPTSRTLVLGAVLLTTYVVTLGAAVWAGALASWPLSILWLTLPAVYVFIAQKKLIAMAIAVAAAIPMGLAPYADGDDSCDGRPSCEDNFGPRLTILFVAVVFAASGGLGAVASGIWRLVAARRGEVHV